MRCSVCAQPTRPFSRVTLLGKYDVKYYQCGNCGFTQTESPYWLKEAYSTPITETDIGMVNRNLMLARIARGLIPVLFNPNARFLDFGGGYGLFVRLMRDSGFDFYRLDRLCPNLFAVGFDAEEIGEESYELVTAFEVFEHLVEPLDEIEGILRFSDSVLFTTMLLPPHNPKPNEWWYYGLEHGQHISLFSKRTLQIIGERFSLNLVSDGRFIHLLTRGRLSPILFRMVLKEPIASALGLLLGRKSLLPQDYFKLTGKTLE